MCIRDRLWRDGAPTASARRHGVSPNSRAQSEVTAMFGPSLWPALAYYQSEGGIRMRDVVAVDADLRTDPQRDVRRLSIFAIGLLAAYAAALVLLWRQGSARNLALLLVPWVVTLRRGGLAAGGSSRRG